MNCAEQTPLKAKRNKGEDDVLFTTQILETPWFYCRLGKIWSNITDFKGLCLCTISTIHKKPFSGTLPDNQKGGAKTAERQNFYHKECIGFLTFTIE